MSGKAFGTAAVGAAGFSLSCCVPEETESQEELLWSQGGSILLDLVAEQPSPLDSIPLTTAALSYPLPVALPSWLPCLPQIDSNP